MEHERFCKLCERDLSPQNPGTICVVCQDKIIKSFDDKPYLDVDELQRLLGLSAGHIRRLGRANAIPGRMPGKLHHYLKTEVNDWVHSEYIFHRPNPKPVGPLQEEAYRLCQIGDHTWLVDERFLGQACTSETSSEIKNNMVEISTNLKCYFCGHKIVKPM